MYVYVVVYTLLPSPADHTTGTNSAAPARGNPLRYLTACLIQFTCIHYAANLGANLSRFGTKADDAFDHLIHVWMLLMQPQFVMYVLYCMQRYKFKLEIVLKRFFFD